MRDRSGLLRWPRDIIAILSALAALLIYFQLYHTVQVRGTAAGQ